MMTTGPPAAVDAAQRPSRWLFWTALGTVYLVWGSTYLAIRILVRTLPPLLAGGARFTVAGVTLLGVFAVRDGRDRLRLTRRELGACALVGALLVLGGNGLVTVGLRQGVPSGLAALIVAAVPLWIVCFRLASAERVPRQTLASVAVGFAGVALLLAPGGAGTPLDSGLLVVAASGSWAMGSFISPRIPLPADGFVSSAVQMAVGGVLQLAAGTALGEGATLDLSAVSAASMAAFAFLVVAGSWAAFTAYAWLLQQGPISTVATCAYVNPVVAVALGWLVLSEPLTPSILGAAAVIVTAVALTVRAESGSARPAPRIER